MLPIVERELRVRSRERRHHWVRVTAALLASALTVLCLFAAGMESNPSGTGTFLFNALRWSLLVLCLLEGIRVATDALSEEKREGTLGLLFLTELSPTDILLGKLSGVSLNSLYSLLATVPMMAVPLLLGGITPGEFWRTVLTLVLTLILSLFVGIAVSARVRELAHGWFWTSAILLGVSAFFPSLAGLATLLKQPIACPSLSPFAAMLQLEDTRYTSNPSAFWMSIGFLICFSGVALGSGVWILQRRWRDTPGSGPVVRPRPMTFRTPSSSAESRTANPIAWLAGRKLQREQWLVFLTLLSALGLVVASSTLAMSDSILGWSILIAISIHAFLILSQSLNAVGIGSDLRSSGAVELILVTPLQSQEIVWGLGKGAVAHLKSPGIILLAGEIASAAVLAGRTIIADVNSAPGSLMAGGLFLTWCTSQFASLWTATWMGLYQGITKKKRGTAIAWTVTWVQIIPWLSYFLCCIWGGPIAGILLNVVVLLWARDRLVFEFPRLIHPENRFAYAPRERDPTRLPRVTPPSPPPPPLT